MNITKRILLGALTGGVLAGSALTGTVFADPPEGGQAGCMGYEAADVSPPGAEDGTFSQHGMPGILEFTDVGVSLGFAKNRGQAFSYLAKFHSGSHEQCDADAGIPPE
jgi:hypothetical protein